MAGFLYITEYPYLGDVGQATPREPATRVQKIAIGEISAPLHPDTHLVSLYATLKCRFCFFAGQEMPEEDCATPMSDDYEIQRLVGTGSKMQIATFDQEF